MLSGGGLKFKNDTKRNLLDRQISKLQYQQNSELARRIDELVLKKQSETNLNLHDQMLPRS